MASEYTDLSDFGAGLEDVDSVDHYQHEQDDDTSGTGYGKSHSYHLGRCRAITTDGQRCRSPCNGVSTDTCHTHRGDDRVTIDSPSVALIEATSRTLWENLDDLDVDADRIRDAVQEVQDGE